VNRNTADRNVCPTWRLLACLRVANDNSYWFVPAILPGVKPIFFPARGLFPQKLVA
jgi:hypothetical protein